uniref:Uncharacterized protein n=1 Tax=Megaviridae environmental sample TaxID=1737588 RepID=A0A5J6VJT3_9VIRU|nr:MAG: hypothetical protein [Megaviridae environmental sample]
MEQPIDNQISNEWVTHVNDVNIKVHNMWNFLVYKFKIFISKSKCCIIIKYRI